MVANSEFLQDRPKREEVRMPAYPDEDEGLDDGGDHVEPLTAAQAQAWRQTHWQPSPWRVLQWQAAAAIGVGLLIWGFSRDSVAIISWFYGALAVWLPALMFAKVVVSQPALGILVMFEMFKLLLNVMLLALAPLLLDQVAWVYLLGAVVLTVNMYWVAPILMARCRRV
ncbi:hypothetical protein E9531_01195 [Lampropedia puyangensis]|uniref:ATP synthase subunit I n=1 Tax=Lampropedia puyangensis TaxID=1330072 RepID=A0A4S8FDJ1_9BURK|nr:hypothetical protein [Lampropedia puyangensis]THU05201.1 hypothetical protein E9531_01195 [Lampropedia puyangensis]